MVETVFHVLSVRQDDSRCLVRGTIRCGGVEAGQNLRFSTPAGEQHVVRVAERRNGPRYVTLSLEGSRADLDCLKGGYYLFDSCASGTEDA